MPIAFEPQQQQFSLTNALYLAHAADVAYLRSPTDAARYRLGLEAVAFRSRLTRLRGFLGVCDTHAVLSFRGTDPVTLQNWLTDAVVKLVTHGDYDGRVHQGFCSVLNRTWKKIAAAVDAVGDRPLFLTGHSMGGALAVLTACRLARLGRAPAAVYTFGAPRVGDLSFCRGYRVPTFRVVNRLDIVPEMPLASLKRLLPARPRFTNEKVLGALRNFARRVPCYGHVKTLVYLDHESRIIMNSTHRPWHADAVLRAIILRGKSFVDGVNDHLISNYIKNLQSATPRSDNRVSTHDREAAFGVSRNQHPA